LAGDVIAVGQTASPRTPAGRLAAFLAPLIGGAVTLYLVLPTLMPGISNWGTAEFQTVAPLLGTAHPTG
jgi:hypothetical protein